MYLFLSSDSETVFEVLLWMFENIDVNNIFLSLGLCSGYLKCSCFLYSDLGVRRLRLNYKINTNFQISIPTSQL